jgi:hypothetical protein
MDFEALTRHLVRGGYRLCVDEVTDKIIVTPTVMPLDDALRQAIREHREALKLLLLVVETLDCDLASAEVRPLPLERSNHASSR